MKRIRNTCIMAMMILVLCLSGCGKGSTASNVIYETKEDFSGSDAACITGTVVDGHVDEVIDNITWHYYDDQAGGLEALKKGDVAASVMDLPVAKVITGQQPEFAIFPGNTRGGQLRIYFEKRQSDDGAVFGNYFRVY